MWYTQSLQKAYTRFAEVDDADVVMPMAEW